MNELENTLIGNSAAAPSSHIIEGLDDKRVHREIPAAPHTIYQELWHMAFWQRISLDWAGGIETAIPAKASDGFPTPAQTSAEPWPQLCQRFLHDSHAAATITHDNSTLEKAVRCPSPPGEPTRTMSVREQLESLAAHNAYHLGRIVLLRQLMQSWPPPSGGFSW